jgi:uncharacterized protein
MSNEKSLISDACTDAKNGVIVTIDVSAGSSMDLFPAGYNSWRKALIIRTKAPAVQGRANKAILCLIAQQLQMKETSLSLISGHTSSVKRICISGISKNDLIHLIQEQMPPE